MIQESLLPVGIVTLSDGIKGYQRDVAKSIKKANSIGIGPELSSGLWDQVHDYPAGSADSRLEQFEWAGDKDFPYIWMAEGGYSMMELILFTERSKRFMAVFEKWAGTGIGYSDSGCLGVAANYIGRQFIHGPNFAGLHQWDSLTHNYLQALMINKVLPSIDENCNWQPWIDGQVTAPIFASNVEVFARFFGTKFDVLKNADPNKGVILALEELGVTQVDVRRSLLPVFGHEHAHKIKGIILGRTLVTNWDYPEYSKKYPLEDMVKELIKESNLKIPFVSLLDFGHPEWGEGRLWKLKRKAAISKSFIPMVNGFMATLTVSKKGCRLQYEDQLWPTR